MEMMGSMEFMVQQVSKGLPEIQGHDLVPSSLWLVWVRTKCHLCGGCEVPNPRGLLSRNRLIGMCCWMGSHFHDSIDFNGVTISTESLEWGRKLSRFWIMQCNFFLFFFFLYLSLIVTVYAKMIAGYVNIITSGGNGKPGQNGANGRKAADSMHKVHYSVIDMRDIEKVREKSLFITWRRREGGLG